MKKQIVSIVTLVSFSCMVSAQVTDKAKDSLMKVMAKEVCSEMSKNDSSMKSVDDLEMQLGLAFLPLMSKYEHELEDIMHVDVTSAEGMEAFGRDLGMQLVVDCPLFMKLIANNPSMLKKTKESIGSSTAQIKGTLVKIVPGEISYLQVKNKSGKLEKIWWMEYFEGSNKLSSDPKSLLNKNVTVTYTEKEIYNAALKDYVKMKVATGIE